MQKRFTEEQIFEFLRQAEAGVPIAELCRKGGFSSVAFYRWRRRYGGMQLSEIRRVRELEAENARLKKLLAETMLDAEALKVALGRKR